MLPEDVRIEVGDIFIEIESLEAFQIRGLNAWTPGKAGWDLIQIGYVGPNMERWHMTAKILVEAIADGRWRQVKGGKLCRPR